jgi:hypothetical protein
MSSENMPPLPEGVAALKDEGNAFFRAGDYLKAAGAYTKALKVRPPRFRRTTTSASFWRFPTRRFTNLKRKDLVSHRPR